MDDLVGELGYGKIGTGLSFIGLVYLGFWLSSLPFDLYHTFVLEERFGFNKTTAKQLILFGVMKRITKLFGENLQKK